jgi:hypothetical protein
MRECVMNHATLGWIGILSLLAGCDTVSRSGDAQHSPVNLQAQCYQHSLKSSSNCEFMNQGNPLGLAECRKTKAAADNRCAQLQQ